MASAAHNTSEDGIVVLHCPPELAKIPLVNDGKSLAWITENVASICEEKTRRYWWIAFFFFSPIALLVPTLLAYQVGNGVGVWGENQPFGWAWDITNFVFWIGIGHAGTLISAILLSNCVEIESNLVRVLDNSVAFCSIETACSLFNWVDLKYKTPKTADKTARTIRATLEVLLLDSIIDYLGFNYLAPKIQ